MQINNSSATNIARLYSRQAVAFDSARERVGAPTSAERPRTDSVAVSQTRSEVARFQTAVSAQPDANVDRVAALKAAIASGSYRFDARALAASLLES